MQSKTFAEDYSQNEQGWFLFPSDIQYRKQLFPKLDFSAHPAKANLFLLQAIIEYVSEPEQTILDIMSGTGSIMVAALIGRRVVCMDIEETYRDILYGGLHSLEENIAPGISEYVTIIHGDCNKLLPLPIADHIIFSPPYAGILKKKKLDKLTLEKLGSGLLQYSQHPDNVGNLNEFFYHERMQSIYQKCYDSLPSGGTLTIILKDHVRDGKRVYLSDKTVRNCISYGFELAAWHKWHCPGTAYTKFMRARGQSVVDEEDIIILRRK